MTGTEIINILEERFGSALTAKKPEALDPSVTLEPATLVEFAKFLRDEPRLRFEMLNCVSGVDYLETDAKKLAKAGFEPHLEIVYHVSSFTHRHRFTFKLVLPRWKENVVGQLPEVPSICQIWPAADWHERETYDMYGITFTGHPDLRRILLAEDWEGYPLRKDYEYPLEYHDIRCR